MRTVILVSGLSLIFAAPALGRTWHVPSEIATIQAAIDSSIDGDIVELADGTYRGPGNRDVSFLGKAITVRSASADPKLCIIDSEGSDADPHRGFWFNADEDTLSILENVSVTGGAGVAFGGGIYVGEYDTWWDMEKPVIRNCIVEGV
jgi:hypothetical protein